MIKIRLARGGRVHRPIYTIVAINARNARNGRFLERLGQYDPMKEAGANLLDVKAARISEWVKQGAEVSDTVRNLLRTNKIQL
jgi:small subunit ribosomal protein S16